ncbi:DnaJ-like protein subfamily A member 1 [Nematocida ausubeli]|nr:DnaJ-like protein subfamily A member 1 [Nematocida ausubeli]
MDVKGYYRMLGIDPNASEGEIKAAYRKLAKKYHSDGQTVASAMKACKTDKEREELKKSMDAKFSEITGAYEVLSVKEKKDLYDRGVDPNEQGGGFGGFSGFGDGDSFFSSFFGGSMGSMFGGERRSQKNTPKIEKVTITLADVLTGLKISRKITRKIVCAPCKSTGSMNTKTCSRCRGAGAYAEITNMGGMRLQREVMCSSCNGHGITKSGPSCSSCAGNGYLKKSENIEISIPAGVVDGYKMAYKGMGDEASGLATGDLVVEVSVKEDETFARLAPEHLFAEIDVPLADLLTMKPIRLVTIDKREITIGYPSLQSVDIGEDYLRVDREGLPMKNGGKGSLFVRIIPTFTSLSKTKELGMELINHTATAQLATYKGIFISKHKINEWYNEQQHSSSRHSHSHSHREDTGQTCQTI